MTQLTITEGKTYKYQDKKVTVSTVLNSRALVSFPKTDGKVRYVWAPLADLLPVRGRPGK